jgi:hypothetical protein
MQEIERKVAVVAGDALTTKEARAADALERLIPATIDGFVARVFKRVGPQ